MQYELNNTQPIAKMKLLIRTIHFDFPKFTELLPVIKRSTGKNYILHASFHGTSKIIPGVNDKFLSLRPMFNRQFEREL